jgi:hypothetical protein
MPTAEQLRRMRWSELERAALEAGVTIQVIRRARTRAELAEAIALALPPRRSPEGTLR